MDAISFVLGVASRHLRGRRLRDLVFHREGERGSARPTSVRLFYRTTAGELDGRDDGDEVEFSRTIAAASSSVFAIDGRECSWDHYKATLRSIGLIIEARNFLVFQVRGPFNHGPLARGCARKSAAGGPPARTERCRPIWRQLMCLCDPRRETSSPSPPSAERSSLSCSRRSPAPMSSGAMRAAGAVPVDRGNRLTPPRRSDDYEKLREARDKASADALYGRQKHKGMRQERVQVRSLAAMIATLSACPLTRGTAPRQAKEQKEEAERFQAKVKELVRGGRLRGASGARR